MQSEGEINIPLSTPEDVIETSKNREMFNYSEQNHIRRPPDPNEPKIFNLEVKEIGVQKIRLPSLDTIKNMQKKKLCKSTFSLDNCKFSFFFHFLCRFSMDLKFVVGVYLMKIYQNMQNIHCLILYKVHNCIFIHRITTSH